MAGIVIPRCPCCGEQTTFKGSNRCRRCTEEGRLAPGENWHIEVSTQVRVRFDRKDVV